MSGIEAAGLALGAFPLLISALEHWRKVIEVSNDWWNVKNECKKCRRQLTISELYMKFNMEKLLLPLVADDDDVAALMRDPGGSKWKDSKLTELLKAQLPESCSEVIGVLEDIKDVMNGLKEQIGLGNPGFVKMVEGDSEISSVGEAKKKRPLSTWFSRAKQDSKNIAQGHGSLTKRTMLEAQAQRLKFSLGRSTRDGLFKRLEDLNGMLERLLNQSEQSRALMKSRENFKKATASKELFGLWRHANSLYDLLVNALCCGCKYRHCLDIRLLHRTHIKHIEFYIRFLYSPSPNRSEGPWGEREILATRLEPNNGTSDIFVQVGPSTPQSGSNLNPPLKSALRNPPSTAYAMKGRNTNSSVTRTRSRVAFEGNGHGSGSETSDRSSATVIQDLCSAIDTYGVPESCIGQLRHDDKTFTLHTIQRDIDFDNEIYTVTLRKVLGKDSKIRASRRQRFHLALTIASSHLQLYSSSWVGEAWTKDDIHFPCTYMFQDPIVERPYLSRQVLDAQQSTHRERNISANRSLQTLGVLLIELCHGTPLEEHEMRKRLVLSVNTDDVNLGDLNTALDITVAREWSRTVSDEAGERYSNAVEWCLAGKVKDRDEQWRKEFFANVVEPLQFCCSQF